MTNPADHFSLNFYKDSIKLLKDSGYTFIFFDEVKDTNTSKEVLWRHDIDFSPQQALHLAKIEKDLSVKGTYFFQTGSQFYNIFEERTKAIIREIAALNHQIGVHFDIGAYKINSKVALERYLGFEKSILEEISLHEINVFSFHNPTIEAQSFRDKSYSNMINVYSDNIRSSFEYCSDSNGVWKDINMLDFIKNGNKKIQILTHPGWWLNDKNLSPNNKVKYLLDKRNETILSDYNSLLLKNGRPNE